MVNSSDSDEDAPPQGQTRASRRANKKGSGTNSNNNEGQRRGREQGEKTQKSSGGQYNYVAIGILALFILPVLITGILKVTDMMYPEEARIRDLRQRTKSYVTRCYEVANPSKLSEVDSLVDRYYGREEKLVVQLRNKYAKYPECH